METNRQTVLQLLKSELEFLDKGGYKRNPRSPWRAPYIFEDSPSCPNASDRARPHLCEECWLMQFVAPELHEEQVPCRFVDLSGNGVTVDNNSDQGDPSRIVYIVDGADSGWRMGHRAQERSRRNGSEGSLVLPPFLDSDLSWCCGPAL